MSDTLTIPKEVFDDIIYAAMSVTRMIKELTPEEEVRLKYLIRLLDNAMETYKRSL